MKLLHKLVSNLPVEYLAKTVHQPWLRMRLFQKGINKELPENYKKFYYQWQVERPDPLYYEPTVASYVRRNGSIHKQKDIPVPLYYPLEFEDMLLGGEAVIEGLKQKPKTGLKMKPINAFYHIPKLFNTILYSEIFDKYMRITVTPRLLTLVDEHKGLDPYIMKTRPCELKTRLAVRLKREMFLIMLKEPESPERKEVFDKYKEYMIPFEEADWFGLTLKEAVEKQISVIEMDRLKSIVPQKHRLREQYIEYLKVQKEQETQD